jgi:hypothetical protein
MSSLPSRLLALALVGAFVSASPTAAKVRKHKKTAHPAATAQARSGPWGTNVFPAGPLYFGGTYLGDDPDPNIRFQLWRDLSGRLGGDD